jgi:hypothetical protein
VPKVMPAVIGHTPVFRLQWIVWKSKTPAPLARDVVGSLSAIQFLIPLS